MIPILLILWGSWFDVDDSTEPVTPPTPAPTVCQCGCRETGCKCGRAEMTDAEVRRGALALIKKGMGGTVGGIETIVRAAHCRGSTVTTADPKPVLMIDEAALESAKPTKLILTIHSPSSFTCPPCNSMKEDAKREGWYEGDSDISLRWEKGDVAGATNYPWFTLEGIGIGYGRTNLAGLRRLLKAQPQGSSRAMGSVTIGSIDGAAIREALSKIPADGVVQVGGAKLTVPKSMATQIDVSPERYSVKFTGTKPRLAYGSGWLSISQPVNGLSVTDKAVTIGLDGFPDLVLAVR